MVPVLVCLRPTSTPPRLSQNPQPSAFPHDGSGATSGRAAAAAEPRGPAAPGGCDRLVCLSVWAGAPGEVFPRLPGCRRITLWSRGQHRLSLAGSSRWGCGQQGQKPVGWASGAPQGQHSAGPERQRLGCREGPGAFWHRGGRSAGERSGWWVAGSAPRGLPARFQTRTEEKAR